MQNIFYFYIPILSGFANQDTPRIHKKELGGGTVLDLGIYLVQLAQLVFGGEEPQQVDSRRSLELETNIREDESFTARRRPLLRP